MNGKTFTRIFIKSRLRPEIFVHSRSLNRYDRIIPNLFHFCITVMLF
jgi:hypothetical protein